LYAVVPTSVCGGAEPVANVIVLVAAVSVVPPLKVITFPFGEPVLATLRVRAVPLALMAVILAPLPIPVPLTAIPIARLAVLATDRAVSVLVEEAVEVKLCAADENPPIFKNALAVSAIVSLV
jgi:hypothetical protein